MARPKVRLNSAGVAAILKSPAIHAMVAKATEEVADAVRSQQIQVSGIPGDEALPVSTQMTTTDRAHGRVTITHAAGQAVQAKHGALTKAADQIGAEVVTE